ncbi:class II holin family protein, partial [Enterobacter roggenkampii]|nr:class II holin family protein [Enterobacter roggenkampii]
ADIALPPYCPPVAGFFISGSGNHPRYAFLLNRPEGLTHYAQLPPIREEIEMIRYMPDKIASAVSYCVSGSLICGGGILQWLHDLDWNKVAVIGGFLIGIATYLTNLYFKRRQTKAYEKALKKGYITAPPQDN